MQDTKRRMISTTALAIIMGVGVITVGGGDGDTGLPPSTKHAPCGHVQGQPLCR